MTVSSGHFPSLFLEEFHVGNRFESREPRTVTKEDIEEFANLTGDMNPLHLDDAFARSRKFNGRIAHGLFTLAIALGQWYSLNLTRDSIVAILGINNLSFRAPVHPGDRIRLASEVIDKRDSKSDPSAGIVVFKDKVLNQDDATVLEFERVAMLKKGQREKG
jgi:acyl dehydratase